MPVIRFVANLADRQSALMLSGSGQRLLIELEAFDRQAAEALRIALYSGRQFAVTIQPLDEPQVNHEIRIADQTRFVP